MLLYFTNKVHATMAEFCVPIQVLTHGTPLLSSTGDEYQSLESDPEYQRMTAQERVAFHRQQLRQRLGLVAQGKVFSTGMEGLFEDSDLVVTTGESKEGNTGNRAKVRRGILSAPGNQLRLHISVVASSTCDHAEYC